MGSYLVQRDGTPRSLNLHVPADATGHPVPVPAPGLPDGPSLEQTARAWHEAGHSQRAIARELNIDRRKVKKIIEPAV